MTADAPAPDDGYDYVVVGAGAAGAVLAARLAEAGRRVLVLEAGDDPLAPEVAPPASDRDLDADARVPAFHPFASEHPGMRWDFWVRHFSDTTQQRRDWKYREHSDGEHVDGVLYPRSSGIGGCANHHALIVARPNNADWNHIAHVTGDPSWRASVMQKYFMRMERCRYRWRALRWLHRLFGWNPTGHGWNGWLATERTIPLRTVLDWRLRTTVLHAMITAMSILPNALERWSWLVRGAADPNDIRLVDDEASGVRLSPMSSLRRARHGPREFLLATQRRHPDRLHIRRNAFVTRVEIDRETRTATGVSYVEGARLYRASAPPHGAPSPERRVMATREVILAGGAFNTPQLMMLSGLGDPQHLAEHGIDAVHPLPGVGRNLQDRYEVGVVTRMKEPWRALRGASFTSGDRPFWWWRHFRRGLYGSNGVIASVMLRSRTEMQRPDLFCFAILADFRGYYPGYSERIRRPDYMTWAILKAYTDNNAGVLRLTSREPLDRPAINFHYFEEGSDRRGGDLDAVVRAVRFVRRVADSMWDRVAEEEIPGRHLYTDEDLRRHVRDTAWGHHACGTCAMGPEAGGGVVDSDFRVHGVDRLRIVDASIFPRIPGYFIACSVFMIAEKAADVILGRHP